ncbi:hypothetical protein EI613_31275 [Azospirillum sp. 412522]|nr:hypothetical protein [Azospirillum sp. 412522]
MAKDATKLAFPLQPGFKILGTFLPDHRLARCNDFTCLDQQRHSALNRRDRHRLRFGQRIPSDGEQARDRSRRRRAAMFPSLRPV